MDMRLRIDAMASALRRVDWARWRSWERYAPAAGSLAAHAAAAGVIALVASGMSASPRHPPALETMSVTLVTDVMPPRAPAQPDVEREPPPTPSAPAAAPDVESIPTPTPRARRRNDAVAPSAAAPAAGGDAGDDVEVLPPAATGSGAPLGLQSLLEKSPCSQVIERLRGDCDSRWAALAEQGGLDHSPTLDELADMYPGFQLEEPDNPFWMPRAPERMTRKPSLAGGRVLAPLGSIPSGVATAGGPASQTGRLPPPSPLHADPAWELPPRWLDRD